MHCHAIVAGYMVSHAKAKMIQLGINHCLTPYTIM